MAAQPQIVGTEGDGFSADHFGGNVLANRGELAGDGQYDEAINDLGVTSLRWPGGSRTEKSFDINEPDAITVTDANTGQVDSWIGLTEFCSYAEENGHPISIVIPTRFNLSEEPDSSGNRTPEFSEADLRQFVRDVASGEYGNPEIHSFEIGNEYWHSGYMNSVEYARLASEMSDIIDDELNLVSETYPSASDIQVTVQMGHNYGSARLNDDYEGLSTEEALQAINDDYGLNLGEEALYSDGTVNFGFVNNMIIINEFVEDGTIDSIDGVIAHVYSLGEENQFSRVFELEMLNDTWINNFPDLDIHVTEWNQRGVTEALERDEDYGLHQAEEMLNIMEEFARLGVDHAHVWPLINFTDNALNNGWTYDETNAPGAMFRMMAENLPGKTLLDLNPNSERVTEAEFEDLNVHGFAGEGELVLYVTATQHDGVTSTNLDLSGLINDFSSIDLTILGVEEGANIGSNRSDAVLETVDAQNAMSGLMLDVNLDPGEIMQVVISGVTPTDALAPIIDSTHGIDEFDVDEDTELEYGDGSTDTDSDYVLDDTVQDEVDDWEIPTVVPPEDIQDDFEEEEPFSEADDAGLSMLIAAMPILGLLAFMG